jgi:type VI secretion system FHA domain protein
MALRLEIISPHRQKLGARGSIVLGVAGGSIGRALDNDWALPDSHRFLSGHHARVHFRAGHYIIEDTSSNGVFINDGTKPLGKRGIHRLAAGDVLRMGEYRILVRIDEDDPAAVPPPGAATMANLTVHNVVPLRVPGSQRGQHRSTEDLGHSLDIESLIPGNASGPIPRASSAALRDISETGVTTGGEAAISSAAAGSMQDRVNRLRAAARARLDGTSPPLAMQGGMQAFCRGAGIDGERIPVTNDAQALYLAGRLLREALQGLKEILRVQTAFDDHYGIEHERPEGRSPLDLGVDDYLAELLTGHEQRKLDAVIGLREQFATVARHDGALDPALRSALQLFVGHLDPSRMDGVPPEQARVRFRDLYANLLRATDGDVPHLFMEALAQAYLEARRQQR